MKPAELNQLKAAVTMPSIDERAAYAHFHEHRQHIASFCGTGNNVQFLSDETGNRRWLPFEIERITSPREVPFDYQGIYSQAYALYQEGFQYWFSREEIQRLSQHNATFETPHTAHELISRYLRKPKPGEPSDFLSATDILQLVGSNPVLKLTTNKIGRAMTDLGFERMRTGSERGYNVVQYSAEEIKARQRMKACDAKPETAGEDDANDTNDAFF
jgi:predicted P-loop ATPase